VVEVLVESVAADGTVVGRAGHQAPEVDGVTTVRSIRPDGASPGLVDGASIGAIIPAQVIHSSGVDLLAAAVRPDRDPR
jgi:hypothetical protein